MELKTTVENGMKTTPKNITQEKNKKQLNQQKHDVNLCTVICTRFVITNLQQKHSRTYEGHPSMSEMLRTL